MDDLQKKILAKLRDPKVKQGTGWLKRQLDGEVCHCALGVVAEVLVEAGQGHWEFSYVGNNWQFTTDCWQSPNLLPTSCAIRIKLSANVVTTQGRFSLDHALWCWNDAGLTLPAIADRLETCWNALDLLQHMTAVSEVYELRLQRLAEPGPSYPRAIFLCKLSDEVASAYERDIAEELQSLIAAELSGSVTVGELLHLIHAQRADRPSWVTPEMVEADNYVEARRNLLTHLRTQVHQRFHFED